ncbi:hypothetical protein ACHHYP_20496 [Achlya hypogyna]|uniref:MULE transposase domain-containing protein n=1 Tax=Achlya hypogyna TaxID=1202772 RepID=A0A1V9YKR5_ACHHY|nr:hypothetical protein ACHHYP_20496 [Achlya hypogyna]
MYRCRKESSGGDIFREVETPPTCFIAPDDKRYFQQFNTTTIHQKKLRRIMGFAHPSLVSKLKYLGLSPFIDGTFRVCPKPFVQCVIMMYDPAHDTYLPVFYVLMDAKDNWAYWEMLNQVKIQCDVKIFPRRSWASMVQVLGLFQGHLAEAVRRVDLECQLRHRQRHGALNRTNNPLEKYNRNFGDKFPAAYPGLLSFIQVTKEDASNYVTRLNDIMYGCRNPAQHAASTTPTIPESYTNFNLYNLTSIYFAF